MDNPAFGRSLREFRKRVKPKLTQEALGKESFIDGSMISRYERDKSSPTPKVLQNIINALALHQVPREELDRLWDLADLRPPGTETLVPAYPIVSFLIGALERSTSEQETRLSEEIRSTVEFWQGYFSAGAILEKREWASAEKVLLHLREQESIRNYRSSLLVDEALGWTCYGQGSHTRAAQQYERAQLAAQYLEHHQQREEAKAYARTAQARLLIRLGDTHRRLARSNMAEDSYQEAARLSKELSNLRRVAYCLRRIAAIYIYQGRAEKALQLCDESLAICQKERDDPGIYKALQHKAWALEVLGHWDEAAQLAEDALDMVRQVTTDEVELAKAYGYLADKRLLQHHLDDAEELYLEAQQIVQEELVATLVSGRFWLGLGQVYLERPGDLLKAQQYLNRSLEQHIQLGEPLGEARTQNQLGRLLVKQGRLDLAEGRYRFAANHFEISDNNYDLADVWVNLAELYYEQENIGEVHRAVDEVMGLRNRPFHIYAARAQFLKGKALVNAGRYSEAYQVFCEASEHALAFNHYIFDEIRAKTLEQIDGLVRAGKRGVAISLCDAYVEFWEHKNGEAQNRESVQKSLEEVRRKQEELAVLKCVE